MLELVDVLTRKLPQHSPGPFLIPQDTLFLLEVESKSHLAQLPQLQPVI